MYINAELIIDEPKERRKKKRFIFSPSYTALRGCGSYPEPWKSSCFKNMVGKFIQMRVECFNFLFDGQTD